MKIQGKIQDKKQVYAFVGMSGVGKSYWSDKFRQAGYVVYPIDDLINEQVADLIQDTKGDDTVKYEDTKVGGLAKWMGFPGDKRYKANSKKYLNLESKITLESLKNALKNNEKAIIDTTGSVIYTDKKVQSQLKKFANIVYLETSQKNLDNMFKIFCEVPKPIIWGDIYKPLKNETEDKTLKRCYKKLLESRMKKYKSLAHTTLSYKFTHQPKQSLEKFIQRINK